MNYHKMYHKMSELKTSDISIAKNLNSSIDKLIIEDTTIHNLCGCPQNIKYLELNSCKNLTSLYGIPPQLDTLVLKSLKIKNLAHMPKYLKSLIIYDCGYLNDINNLPSSLETLKVYACDNFDNINIDAKETTDVRLYMLV